MPTLELDGVALAYDVDGDGPVVVFLHAGIADRRMWQPVAAELARRGYRAIRYDLTGYGDSGLPAQPFAHYDHLAGFLDALGIARAVLVGCSFGGAVAIDTALAHPGRVSALALVGAAVRGHVWSDEFHRLWDALIGDVDEEDLDASAAAEVRFWVVGPDRQPNHLEPRFLAFAREMDRRALAGEELLDQLGVRELEPPAAGRLAEIQVPTLVMAGAADVPEIRRLADRLAAEIPQARRLPDIPDAAHLLPLERPEPVAAALLDFLQTLPPAA
jgi:3-oxoadipate enol-lactonase